MSRSKAHNSRRYHPVTSRIDAEEPVAGPDLGLVLAYWLWWSSRTEVCLRSRGLYRQRWSTSQLTRLRTLDEPEIGRATCRERGQVPAGACALTRRSANVC